MSVTKPDKKTSKTEFDRVYYIILKDSIQITDNCFGADKKKRDERKPDLELSRDLFGAIVRF